MVAALEPFSSTTSAMDDPITPLYTVPGASCQHSFETELQQDQDDCSINNRHNHQNNLQLLSIQQQHEQLKQPTLTSDNGLLLPVDLFDYLENIPFDIEEFINHQQQQQETEEVVMPAGGGSNGSGRSQLMIPSVVEELETPTFEQHPDVTLLLLGHQQEMTVMADFEEEMDVFSLVDVSSFVDPATADDDEASTRPRLGLDLPFLMPTTIGDSTPAVDEAPGRSNPVAAADELSTPTLIKMILDKEATGKHQQLQSAGHGVPEAVSLLNDVELREEVIGLPASVEDAVIPSAVASTRGRSTASRRVSSQSSVSSSSSSSRRRSSSDLRRVRNNEASRKSRQNRRQRLQGQAQLVGVLEEEGRRLSLQVRQLEELKAKIMKYMTGATARVDSTTSNIPLHRPPPC